MSLKQIAREAALEIHREMFPGLVTELNGLQKRIADQSGRSTADQRDHQVAEIVAVLKAACDRDWTDETPLQVAHIAANAIYWRDRNIALLRAELDSIAHCEMLVTCDTCKANAKRALQVGTAADSSQRSERLDSERSAEQHTIELQPSPDPAVSPEKAFREGLAIGFRRGRFDFDKGTGGVIPAESEQLEWLDFCDRHHIMAADPAVSVEHEPPESKIATLAEVKDLYAAGLQVGIEMGRRLGNGGSGGFTTDAAGHNVVAGDAPEFGHVGDTPEDDAIADVLNALTEVAEGDGDIDELRETCAAALNSLKTLVRFIDAVRAASPPPQNPCDHNGGKGHGYQGTGRYCETCGHWWPIGGAASLRMREEEKNEKDYGAALLPADPSASPAATETLPNAVEAEIERALNRIARDSFLVDYAVIKRGDGGLGAVVELSTATHAILFIRRALRDSGNQATEEHAATTRRSEAQ